MFEKLNFCQPVNKFSSIKPGKMENYKKDIYIFFLCASIVLTSKNLIVSSVLSCLCFIMK